MRGLGWFLRRPENPCATECRSWALRGRESSVSTVSWILSGIGLWCVVSVGVGLVIGRFLQAGGPLPRPAVIFRTSAARLRGRALGGPMVSKTCQRRRPAAGRAPGPGARPSESPPPASSSPRHGPRCPIPLAQSHAGTRAALGIRLPEQGTLLTATHDVASDDALLDRLAAAPLNSCPLVDDGVGGELATRLMAWRRQVEELNLPTPRTSPTSER